MSVLWSGGVSRYEVQFRRNVGRDEARPPDHGVSDFSDPYVGCETLVLLSDAGLQHQVQLAPTDCLNKQLMGSFLMRWTIFIREIDQGLGQPAGETHVGVKRIDLALSDRDGDLDPAFPTPFLDIEYTGGGEGSSLHWLRSDKQRHPELRRLWCMLDSHGAHCNMTTDLNGRLIDGLVTRR